MVDSITSATSAPKPVTTPVSSSRSHVTINAIAQTQQKRSGATNTVTALAVPQSAKSGNTSNTKVPRGSLVDVLA
jgi:hypothetical protein